MISDKAGLLVGPTVRERYNLRSAVYISKASHTMIRQNLISLLTVLLRCILERIFLSDKARTVTPL